MIRTLRLGRGCGLSCQRGRQRDQGWPSTAAAVMEVVAAAAPSRVPKGRSGAAKEVQEVHSEPSQMAAVDWALALALPTLADARAAPRPVLAPSARRTGWATAALEGLSKAPLAGRRRKGRLPALASAVRVRGMGWRRRRACRGQRRPSDQKCQRQRQAEKPPARSPTQVQALHEVSASLEAEVPAESRRSTSGTASSAADGPSS